MTLAAFFNKTSSHLYIICIKLSTDLNLDLGPLKFSLTYYAKNWELRFQDMLFKLCNNIVKNNTLDTYELLFYGFFFTTELLTFAFIPKSLSDRPFEILSPQPLL